MSLRCYQRECIAGIEAAFLTHRSALAVLPTGSGKTVVFATLGRDWPTGRVLILAHREELIDQAADKVQAITGERPDVEMADRRASPVLWGGSKIVVASVATLFRERRLTQPHFDPSAFGLVIVDESHHDVPANTMYRRIREHFVRNPATKFLGVTATPDRGDKRGLDGHYETVAYRYRLQTAIDDGWLVPIRQQFVTCQSLDFSKAKQSRSGDFTDGSIAAVMEEEHPLHEVVAPTLDIAGDRVTLVFAASIRHAELMADIINRSRPGRAIAVHGGNAEFPLSPDERRRRLTALRRGEFQYLVGCDVFYEGFDFPPIACVAVARPTKSRSRYAQAVGRGTRTVADIDAHADAAARKAAIAGSGKPDVLVLDFVGASSSLKLDLCSTADLLAGEASAEAVRRAAARAKAKGGSADMRAEVEAAEREIVAEREKAKRQAVTARAEWHAEEVDPFGWGGPAADAGAGLKPGEKAPTPGQTDFLRARGVNPDRMTRRQASAVIDKLRDTPTLKQKSALARYGESAKTAAKASALLNLLSARGWRKRDYALTRDRWALRLTGDGYRAVVKDPEKGPIVLGRTFATEQCCREFIGKCLETEPLLAAA